MTERTYGTANRLDPAGMSRPCRRLRRAASESPPHFLYSLLQWRENTPFPEQGCASPTGCSGRRTHSSDSNSRRITPSVCSDSIADSDIGRDRRILRRYSSFSADRSSTLIDADGSPRGAPFRNRTEAPRGCGEKPDMGIVATSRQSFVYPSSGSRLAPAK
jgi:hypothetical protein